MILDVIVRITAVVLMVAVLKDPHVSVVGLVQDVSIVSVAMNETIVVNIQ